MNSALFHAARPGDIRSGGLGGREGAGYRPGMREAAAMAKEMGFDQDFGPQVSVVTCAPVVLEQARTPRKRGHSISAYHRLYRSYVQPLFHSFWCQDLSCSRTGMSATQPGVMGISILIRHCYMYVHTVQDYSIHCAHRLDCVLIQFIIQQSPICGFVTLALLNRFPASLACSVHTVRPKPPCLQAANMWKMLDDLAVTDSAAYAEMAKAGAEALVRPTQCLKSLGSTINLVFPPTALEV